MLCQVPCYPDVKAFFLQERETPRTILRTAVEPCEIWRAERPPAALAFGAGPASCSRGSIRFNRLSRAGGEGVGLYGLPAIGERGSIAQGRGDMSEIINIGGVFPSPPVGGAMDKSAFPSTPLSVEPAEDAVELSRFGRALAEVMGESTLRAAKVRAVRVEIAEGTFETRERINGTADHLLKVIA